MINPRVLLKQALFVSALFIGVPLLYRWHSGKTVAPDGDSLSIRSR